jgi:hypothetical protein
MPIVAMLSVISAVSAHADTADSGHAASFSADASSSGWIDFTPYTNFGIYLPVKINGQDVMALLYGGPTSIDESFAVSTGQKPETVDAGPITGLEVQAGGLALHKASAKRADLKGLAYAGKILGRPVSFLLGEEVFNEVVVDIDSAGHRVAFVDPSQATKPPGAIEIPVVELEGERVVPISIDGAAPAQFELELGNVIGPLLVTPAYAREHNLLAGHATSQRLSGRFTETVVSLDHLGFAGIDFPHAPIALIPDTEVPPASIAGGVGLPLLGAFRLVIDYPHNRIYAVPGDAKPSAPIPKDRIGLVLSKVDNQVMFVAPNSPAEAAGFKKGDRIAQIDGKPYEAVPPAEIIGFQMTEPGTTHVFTMTDGSARQVVAADFF